jgi:sugar phosphate isomerase/epimerase
MKIAFSTLGCPTWTWQRIVTEAQRMGYNGIELRFVADQRDLLATPELQKEMIPLAKQQLKEANLAVCSVDSSVQLVNQDDAMIEAGKRHIDLAADLGAPFMRVFGGTLPKDKSKDSAFQTAAVNFRALADHASGRKVRVLIETHDDFSSAESVAQLLKRVNHPNTGVLWDIHHPYRIHGETPAQAFAAIGPHVHHVHVKDSKDIGGGKFRYCLLGEGDVPIAQCLNLLKTAGYDGWIALEWEKTWHPEIEEPEVVFPQFIEKIMKVM